MTSDPYVFAGDTPFDCADFVDGVLDEIGEQGDDDEDDDGWQQFKDDVAMGIRDREGNYLDQPDPDYDERPVDDYDPPAEPPDEDPWVLADPMANRPLGAGEARSLLREAVRLNITASKFDQPTQFSAERDQIVADLTAAGHPANYADYEHPSDV